VRVLLDTHAFLWHLADSAERSEACKDIMADSHNELLLSMGSCWEMAIKQSLGKLGLSLPFGEFLTTALQQNRIDVLPIKTAHLDFVASLQFHHRDPFDRLLVAQALFEGVPLLSCDARLDAYAAKRIW
jgi:PIN domain nuclease of toxin-antitoxin system